MGMFLSLRYGKEIVDIKFRTFYARHTLGQDWSMIGILLWYQRCCIVFIQAVAGWMQSKLHKNRALLTLRKSCKFCSVCTYTYKYLLIHKQIHKQIQRHIHILLHIQIHIHIHIYIYIYTYTYIHILYIYICIYIHLYLYKINSESHSRSM